MPHANESLEVQHGGSHYKGMSIQPIEITMANRYDGCIHSAVKYVSRHADKNGALDLRKAGHFNFLRLETMPADHPVSHRQIFMSDYIEANGIEGPEAEILEDLDAWARLGVHGKDPDIAQKIQTKIDALIALRYPEEKEN